MNDLITPTILRDVDRAFFWAERGQFCQCAAQCNRVVTFWKQRNSSMNAAVTRFASPN